MSDHDLTKQNQQDRVLLGISGGVDSSVAALLLKQSGMQVVGLTMITQPAAEQAVNDARAICDRLGIQHLAVDIVAEFTDKIIRYFVSEYTLGRTPNPCIMCNPQIKFDLLYRYADQYNCNYVATGHYAHIKKMDTGRFALEKSPIGYKDQSYFLYRLSQRQLSGLRFPLAEYDKTEVRAIAAANGLLTADGNSMGSKPDSQDNCFIPEGGYADFIKNYLEINNPDMLYLTEPGNVEDSSGKIIGRHRGLINYTIGQRKGFEVKTTERLFVIGRNILTNTLIVGSHQKLQRKQITVSNVVFSGVEDITEPIRLNGKIRHSASEQPCRIEKIGPDRLLVVFDEPVISPVAGQSCVFYDVDKLIMAGGLIEESFDCNNY